jgi:zinc and cadmium transporter
VSALLTLASVSLVSAIPLIGLALIRLGPRRTERLLMPLVSFAVGAMLGSALLHLVPEALSWIRSGSVVSFYILSGFLGFFVLEKSLAADRRARPGGLRRLQPVAVLNLLGDALHNLVDGMVIAAAYLAGGTLGATTTLAVVLHEVPQEIGDLGVLIYAGLPLRRAVLFNLASALTALLGAAITLGLGRRSQGFADALLPLAAGAFLYVAAAGLIPELRRQQGRASSWRQIVFVFGGVAVMAIPVLVD